MMRSKLGDRAIFIYAFHLLSTTQKRTQLADIKHTISFIYYCSFFVYFALFYAYAPHRSKAHRSFDNEIEPLMAEWPFLQESFENKIELDTDDLFCKSHLNYLVVSDVRVLIRPATWRWLEVSVLWNPVPYRYVLTCSTETISFSFPTFTFPTLEQKTHQIRRWDNDGHSTDGPVPCGPSSTSTYQVDGGKSNDVSFMDDLFVSRPENLASNESFHFPDDHEPWFSSGRQRTQYLRAPH